MTEFEETILLANKILDRPSADPDDDLAMLSRQFLRALECIASNKKCNDNMERGLLVAMKERDDLRAALLPFAAGAGRPGGLADPMTGKPLPDDAVLGLGVKLSAWRRAIELTGAE